MNTTQAHLDIARERFLEMMAAYPGGDPGNTAVIAIEQADAFVKAYTAINSVPDLAPRKMRGCRACHGSGGKASDPCRTCGGSGKVAE